MKIALINENSQASKNTIIYKELKNVANIHGDTVYNYGMESAEENNLTYVQAGLLAAILINSKAADFVVTGCGTGEGACLALNSFPNVLCGHIEDPTDAYLFSQINAGNAVALGYAKGFGWGSELTLRYIFEKLSGLYQILQYFVKCRACGCVVHWIWQRQKSGGARYEPKSDKSNRQSTTGDAAVFCDSNIQKQ